MHTQCLAARRLRGGWVDCAPQRPANKQPSSRATPASLHVRPQGESMAAGCRALLMHKAGLLAGWGGGSDRVT